MPEITINGVKFTNLPNKRTGAKLGNKITQTNFTGNIQEYLQSENFYKLLCSIDIDWGGIEVEENVVINDTAELINWIKSIEGQAGATGAQGPKGDTGAQGPKGDTGTFDNSTLNNYVTLTKYNELIDWVKTTFKELKQGIANNGEYNPYNSLQELVNKCDFDGDGIVSIIDYQIITWIITGVITSEDPKYDSINKTYNGVSLDINGDGDADIADGITFTNIIRNELNKYFNIEYEYNYNDLENNIKSYYRNHNYTWPTLEQVEYFKNNNNWIEDNSIHIEKFGNINKIKELVNKCDFDGDGIVSIIDYQIITWIVTGVITSEDPKYDSINKTYNGVSLDINGDGDADIADGVTFTNIIKNELNKYFNITISFKYNGLENDIKSYYRNHNYTWPTLEQVENYQKNKSWN